MKKQGKDDSVYCEPGTVVLPIGTGFRAGCTKKRPISRGDITTCPKTPYITPYRTLFETIPTIHEIFSAENYAEAEGLWNGVVNYNIEDKNGDIWKLGRDKLAAYTCNHELGLFTCLNR